MNNRHKDHVRCSENALELNKFHLVEISNPLPGDKSILSVVYSCYTLPQAKPQDEVVGGIHEGDEDSASAINPRRHKVYVR